MLIHCFTEVLSGFWVFFKYFFWFLRAWVPKLAVVKHLIISDFVFIKNIYQVPLVSSWSSKASMNVLVNDVSAILLAPYSISIEVALFYVLIHQQLCTSLPLRQILSNFEFGSTWILFVSLFLSIIALNVLTICLFLFVIVSVSSIVLIVIGIVLIHDWSSLLYFLTKWLELILQLKKKTGLVRLWFI